jgi:hypothetical protein
MRTKPTLLFLGCSLLLAGGVGAADLSAAQAEALLRERGFTEIGTMTFSDGSWRAIARNAEGLPVDVTLDPIESRVTFTPRTTVTTTTTTTPPTALASSRTVKVERVIEQPAVRTPIVVEERVLVPVGGKIDKSTVRAVLAANGYTDIHDIDWLETRGVWKAEADNRLGDDREVHVDPIDGRILHVEDD